MSTAAAWRPLKFLLPTIGSAGDVHPFIGLGLALRARGHRATILTNPVFQSSIERQGLGFLPLGTVGDYHAALADPNLWHARKGFEVVARRVMVPAIDAVYRLIEAHADADTVVAAAGLCLGARVAQERLGVPTATVHLQPTIIRSLVDQGLFGTVRISAAQPPWFKRAVFRLADWAVIDRHLQRPLNAFRATLGLAPVDRVLHRWVHSPHCVIGFFPAWFAAPQPDWPPHTHLVGFPLWDGGGGAPLPAAAADFFGAGEPPVLITPGSAAAAASRFFRESVAAAGRLGRRAALVTNHPQQLPRVLPPHVASFGYLPFSEVLPHCALLVHHGGIGTLAQAIRAGIPHLVVPCSHDQFDNAWRIDRLGLGRRIAQTRYRAAGAAAAIHALLADGTVRARCRDFAARVDGDSAVRDACGLLEELAMPATASNAVRRG